MLGCCWSNPLGFFFRRLQGDDMAFCHCHWWWVGLRPHYNASHRGTLELRKQPSWRSERNSLVCALENRGAARGIFLLLRKWCWAPVGQKSAAFCTNAPLPHLACFCCLRIETDFEGYAAIVLCCINKNTLNTQYVSESDVFDRKSEWDIQTLWLWCC